MGRGALACTIVAVLCVFGCDDIGDVGDGYAVLDRGARAAGVVLIVEGTTHRSAAPVSVPAGFVAYAERDGAEVLLDPGPDAVTIVQGAAMRAETYLFGRDVSFDHAWISGRRAAVDALARRTQADVADRIEGGYELRAPGLWGLLADEGVSVGIEEITPLTTGPDGPPGLRGAIQTPYGAGDDAGLGEHSDFAAEVLAEGPAIMMGAEELLHPAESGLLPDISAPELEGSTTLPLLVGVYRAGEHRLVLDASGHATLDDAQGELWGEVLLSGGRLLVVGEERTLSLSVHPGGLRSEGGESFTRFTGEEP